MERTTALGLQEQPVDHSRPVARPHDGHVILVHHWVLLHNLLDQVQDERDIVRLALLIIHIPAPLVAIGCHHYDAVSQETESSDIALTTVAVEVDNQRKLFPISWQNLRQLQDCFPVKALRLLAPTLPDSQS